MVVCGMSRIGKKILKKLEVDGCSQDLGSRRTEWGSGRPSTTETLVFKGYKLSPFNQKVLSQTRLSWGCFIITELSSENWNSTRP